MLQKRFFKIIIPLLFLSLLPAVSGARDKFPPPQGYVSDYSGVLSSRAKSHLTALIKELERKTKAEVAIAIIPDLGGSDIETYAVELFEHWGIGKKGQDNGLLILLALKERKVRIEVGYGLEGIIPDGLAGDIIRKMTPFLRKGDYNNGLLQATSFIAALIANEAGVKLNVPSAAPAPTRPVRRRRSAFGSLLNLLFLIILIIFFIRHPRLFLLLMLGSMLGGRRRGGYWSGGGGFGGGFGGFGGGMSGGGGASGGW